MSQEFIKVAEAMQITLRTINGLASVQDAIDEMKRHSVSSLMIERRNEADEYGIVTVHDIAEKVVAINKSTERTSIYEIMTKPALALSPEMNVKYAIRMLSRFRLTRALVTNDTGVVGLVTLRDLVVRYVDDDDDES